MYGAWISKNGFIPVENYQDHDVIAIKELFSVLKIKEGREDTRKYSLYRIMYRLGYISVKYTENNDYVVSYWNELVPSKFQWNYIENAQEKDLIEIYYTRKKRGILELVK